MIVEKINRYLVQQGKSFNEAIAIEAARMFSERLRRQTMQDDELQPGKEYATLYTKACARQSAYKYHGVEPDEPLSPRAKINFLCGDIVEVAVWTLARLAGCNITHNNVRLTFKALNQDEIAVRPDGVYRHDDGTLWNVEIKKMNEHVFDAVTEAKRMDDTWGYRTQSTLEIAGWKNINVDVEGTVFVMLRGITGHVDELIDRYDYDLLNRAMERRAQVLASRIDDLPPRGYAPEPEQEYVRGKPKDGAKFVSRNKMGYYVATGRSILPVECSYCSFHKKCYGDVRTEFKSGRPVFVVEGAHVS